LARTLLWLDDISTMLTPHQTKNHHSIKILMIGNKENKMTGVNIKPIKIK